MVYLLEAKALRAELANQYPNKPEYRAALARTHSSIANLCKRLGTRPQDTEQNYLTGLEILQALVKEHPSFEHRSELAVHDIRVANFYYATRNFEGAEGRWAEAVQLYEVNLQERPNDRSTREYLADAYQYLGVACTDLGKVDRAREVTLRALATLQQLVHESPSHAGTRNSLASCFNNLSRVYRRERTKKRRSWLLSRIRYTFSKI